MKKILLSLLTTPVFLLASAQQKQFDIVSYNLPKGFTEEQTAERVTLTKDGGSKGFCIITLFKSIDAGNDSKKNFDLSWAELVKKVIPVNAPVMQPPVLDDGWKTEVGSSSFSNEGITGTSILISSTKESRLQNMLILVNGAEMITEMENFLSAVKMNLPSTAVAETKNNNNDPLAYSNSTTPKHEVWMNYGFSAVKNRYTVRYLLKYANGDCLGYIPEQGVLGFSKATDNKTDRHWGVSKDNGTQTHIEYIDGSVLKLGKESATKVSYPPGSKTSFYFKCISVDGLKLDGEWSSGGSYANPNWYKLPNFDGGTIRFYKDGRFENNKGYVSMKEGTNGYITSDKGNGTYYIKDFTLIMKYSDGEEFRASITGLKSVNPAQDNAILFFRELPFFKRLK